MRALSGSNFAQGLGTYKKTQSPSPNSGSPVASTGSNPPSISFRDYIHVVDLAKAHVVALNRLINNKNELNYETFNVGTGRGSSVLEVIKAFEKVSGEKLNYKIANRRAGDIISAYADTTKANQKLGWKANLTLEDAMLSAWKWEQYIRDI